MIESIERLLILQNRDQQIRRVRGELARLEPERQTLRAKGAAAQAELEQAKERLRRAESGRKSLELEVNDKNQLIVKYSNQQFLTRKNEEYRALAHEIETCKQAISQLEDRELALMEQADALQREIAQGTRQGAETQRLVSEQLARLEQREQTLKQELAGLETNRQELAAAVGETERARYDRLVRSKGEAVVVGIQHGVCGGCHVRLPPQVLVFCQADKELITCGNCGRILYYTPDMDLTPVD
jgi:hypothetical protein